VKQLLPALSRYISVLENSASKTTRAEDRVAYTKHLAEAARMFRAAQDGAMADLKDLVASERNHYGRSFLYGESGSKAEAAFNEFAKLVEAA
jgi:hypothetical protein